MTKILDHLAAWSVRHRSAVVVLLLTITAISVVGYVDPQIVLSLLERRPPEQERELEADSDDVTVPPDVEPLSLSGSDAVLVVQSPDFFTSEGAAAMRQVVEDLESLDAVRSILWMDRVPILNIFGLPEPLLPRSSASESRFAAAKEKALRHPLVGGQLLSDDTQTLLLLVDYNYYHILDDDAATGLLRRTAEETAAQFPQVDLTFRVTGRVPSQIAAVASHEANQLKFQLIGYGMILVVTTVLFRGIRAVIIVALAPVTGVFWTLGIVRFFGYDDNPLIDVILPILVSLVALTDGVHLMVQIRTLRAAGMHHSDAAPTALRQVGLACFLTSLTTAIGFGSLMLADSLWVQQFGLCCMIGVLMCFVAVVTLIPLACSSWLGRNVHVGHERSLIDQNLGRVGGLISVVLRHRVGIGLAGIIATLVFGAVALTLSPDRRLSDGLPQKAEATQAMAHVDRALGGLEFARVQISWAKEIPAGSAKILEVVVATDDLLRSEPMVSHPLSIRNLIDAQPGSGPPEERMTLLELLPPPLKRAFYTPERQEAVVTFRVQDLGMARYGPVFERIESGLEAIQREHPGFEFQLTGAPVWRWRNLFQIVVDLASSLGTASVIILIVLAIVYRSIRLGLISIIPNLFPLAFTGAYLVVAGYNLEVVMVCNFTVCLGIAVDDTIHFLTRFREEQHRTDNDDVAIERAFTGVGTALIMTTLVLVAGFSVVTFSDARDHHIFGVMGTLTIAAALFCDLIFLPALLGTFASKRKAIQREAQNT